MIWSPSGISKFYSKELLNNMQITRSPKNAYRCNSLTMSPTKSHPGYDLTVKIMAKLNPGYNLATNTTVKHIPGYDLATKIVCQIILWDMFGRGYGLAATPVALLNIFWSTKKIVVEETN